MEHEMRWCIRTQPRRMATETLSRMDRAQANITVVWLLDSLARMVADCRPAVVCHSKINVNVLLPSLTRMVAVECRPAVVRLMTARLSVVFP